MDAFPSLWKTAFLICFTLEITRSLCKAVTLLKKHPTSIKGTSKPTASWLSTLRFFINIQWALSSSKQSQMETQGFVRKSTNIQSFMSRNRHINACDAQTVVRGNTGMISALCKWIKVAAFEVWTRVGGKVEAQTTSFPFRERSRRYKATASSAQM